MLPVLDIVLVGTVDMLLVEAVIGTGSACFTPPIIDILIFCQRGTGTCRYERGGWR